MFRKITVGEVKIGERLYQLLCECDSPIEEVQTALILMKEHCADKLLEAKKIQDEKISEEALQE